jgi:quercetin dioxygenase-like cupin family protein
MIVRHENQDEVRKSFFKAHGGGEAVMLLDSSLMQNILFLAQGDLKPGKEIESHVDPYEEIYYILEGEALMMVGGEKQRVKPNNAIWIPCGATHSLKNDGKDVCKVLIFAAMPAGFTTAE